MDSKEIAAKVKLLLGLDDSQDSRLEALAESCAAKVLSLTRLEALTTAATDIVVELTIFRFNRLGAEGLSAESHSGVSQSYIGDIPADVRRQLRRLRRLGW